MTTTGCASSRTGQAATSSRPPVANRDCVAAAEAAADTDLVQVRRSNRRSVTVAAQREAGHIVVSVPAELDDATTAECVDGAVAQLVASERRRQRTPEQLLARARQLSDELFHGRLQPRGVCWSAAQTRVWGTCCPETGMIRLAAQLQRFPLWVQDYVLVHELVHLLEPTHSDRFWALVGEYPDTDRARGFLEGVAMVEQEGRPLAG